jgi:hypothetical protein
VIGNPTGNTMGSATGERNGRTQRENATGTQGERNRKRSESLALLSRCVAFPLQVPIWEDVPPLRFLYVNTSCCVFVQFAFAFCVSAPFLLRFRCIAFLFRCPSVALRYRHIAFQLCCVPIVSSWCVPLALRCVALRDATLCSPCVVCPLRCAIVALRCRYVKLRSRGPLRFLLRWQLRFLLRCVPLALRFLLRSAVFPLRFLLRDAT